jgi:IMP dehydrogenase/GMP reductase
LKQEGSTKSTQETAGEATEQAHRVEVKHSEDILIELLKKELEEKNKQIERQQQTIDDMQKTLTNLVNQQQQLSGALMLNAKNETSEDLEETPTEQGAEAVKKKRFGLFRKK